MSVNESKKIIMETVLCLYVILIQQTFLIQADEICYYRNQSIITTISCSDVCCSQLATSPQTACCSTIAWSKLAIPILIVGGICCLTICLVYFRSLWKYCVCKCKHPFMNRRRIPPPAPTTANNNPIFVVNNDELPDYETITKDARVKDIIPPSYNFVAAHPTDFGIDAQAPSAPPEYYSRRNSTSTIGPTTTVQS